MDVQRRPLCQTTTYRQGVHTLALGPLLHVKLPHELQHQLQVLLHRESVGALGVLSIRAGSRGGGDHTPQRTRQVLRAAHCVGGGAGGGNQ